MTPRRRLDRVRTGSIAVVSILAVACLEPPIEEEVEIRFLPDRSAVVTTRVAVSDPEGTNRQVRERIRDLRRAIEERRDPWSRRMAATSPDFERIRWDRTEGKIDRVVHHARVEDPTSIGAFFEDTTVAYVYDAGEDWSELALYPGPATRATQQQRRRLRNERDPWEEAVAAYLEQASRLYGYLAERPERAESCLGALFAEHLSSERAETIDEPEPDEEILVDSLQESMNAVLGVFEALDDEALSLNELSRLVHDPFPAPVRVLVPGDVLGREGFDADRLEVPEMSLWAALARLEGLWIRPDPLVALYAHLRANAELPFDLDGFLAAALWSSRPPSATEVRDEIDARLSHPPVYRVRWRVDPDAKSAAFDWKEADAE